MEYETELALSETTDNSAALTEWDGYEADVTLTRTLQAGGWNTFAIPYDISAGYLNVLKNSDYGMTVKELTSSTLDGNTLTLNFGDASSIEAGKPYLVKVTKALDFSTLAMAGVIVKATPKPFTSTDVDFVPTLGKTLVTGPEDDKDNKEAVLFLAANNTLVNPSVVNDPEQASSYMKGFRAYFQLKGLAANQARAFSIDFGDGETTGIVAIGADRAASTDNATYTLDGRRISKATQKGVYIQNGKKVIIRSATQGDACQSKK